MLVGCTMAVVGSESSLGGKEIAVVPKVPQEEVNDEEPITKPGELEDERGEEPETIEEEQPKEDPSQVDEPKDSTPITEEPPRNYKVEKASGTYVVDVSALNVRTGAGPSFDILGVLKAQGRVEVIGKTDNGWFQIQYKGKEAFIHGGYVKEYKATNPSNEQKPSSNPSADPKEENKSSNPSQNPPKDPKKDTPSPPPQDKIKVTEIKGEYTVTATSLNVRSGPGTNYSKIGSLKSGKKVQVTGKTASNWYRITFNGTEAYISGEYITNKPIYTGNKSENKNEAKGPVVINGILIANKNNPLPASYAPGESKEARAAFNKMKAEAKKHGFELDAFSTYRSYATQKKLYDGYVARDGKAAADRYSARPGTSEHQTGLAFDIGEVGKSSTRFQESDATRWLAQNSYKYGFILRYPQGKEHITGYMYEPWHFRYVGVDVATQVYNSGLTLEEFLGIK